MEFSFYTTVAIVATVFLILLLTAVGLTMKESKAVNFPPNKSSCPDYWIADHSDPEKIICTLNPLNMGTIKKDTDGSYLMSSTASEKNKAYTPGYDAVKRTVNFADPLWSSAFSASGQCALKQWANKYEISWEGVSNFNQCAGKP